MSGPDQRKLHGKRRCRNKTCNAKQQGRNQIVQRIVGDRAQARSSQVAKH